MRLMLLILLALAPVSGLMITTAAEQRRLAAQGVQENTLRLIRPISAEYERSIEATHQFLAVLGRLPSVREVPPTACSGLFQNLLAQHPQYANLGIIGQDGFLICSALPTQGPVNLADRAYFRRALRTRDFAVGEYQIGRITGKATLNFGYPLMEGRRVRSVLYAALDLSAFNDRAVEANLPPGSVVLLVDHAGTVLARFPDSGRWVGRSLKRDPVVGTVLRKGRGVTSHEDVDGVSRLYAFAPLGGTPLRAGAYLAIGVPKIIAYKDANAALIRNLVVLGLVGLVTLLAAWIGGHFFVLQRTQALVRTTKQISEGDWSARTGQSYGNDELGQLARAFDRMAASLETAQKQLLETAEEKKRFYRDVIRAVSQDKFHLVDAKEIPLEGELVLEVPLDNPMDDRAARKRLREVARELGMSKQQVGDLVLAVGEAATNAVKHANTGRCAVRVLPDRVVVRVSDKGKGIETENLPATILMAGFSTKVSMGMGYTLMMQLVDRIWLATGPEGTVIQLEKKIHPEEGPDSPLVDVMERFSTP